MTEFALFDTPLGVAAIGWHAGVVAAVEVPGGTAAHVRRAILRKLPGAVEAEPTPSVAEVIARIRGLLTGTHDDLVDVEVDLSSMPQFQRRVYEFIRTIEPGAALTYGEVAERVGEPGAAQAVGQAMGNNPVPIIVPCHRVVAAGGKLGGFSAYGGSETKRRMLVIEGADLPETQPVLFD